MSTRSFSQTFNKTKDRIISQNSSKFISDFATPKNNMNSKSSENLLKKRRNTEEINIIKDLNILFPDKKDINNKIKLAKLKKNILSNYYSSKITKKINQKEKKVLKNKEIINKYKFEKHNEFEQKEDLKKIKLKLHLIMSKNKYPVCNHYEKNNNDFNFKFMEYLNSSRYMAIKKQFQNNFHFNKNDLNKAHDPFEQMIDLSEFSIGVYKISDIFKQLNENEKKNILLDPYYFIKDRNYYKSLNSIKIKSLMNTLNEEEEEEENIRKKKLSLEKNKKSNFIDGRKERKFKKFPLNNQKKYLSEKQKIEIKTNKKLNRIFSAKLKKNNTSDNLFESEINSMKKKLILIGQEKYDEGFYEKNIKDNKYFLKEKNKRDYLIKMNKKRIDKEELYKENNNKERNQNSGNDFYLRDYMIKLKDLLVSKKARSKSVNSKS